MEEIADDDTADAEAEEDDDEQNDDEVDDDDESEDCWDALSFVDEPRDSQLWTETRLFDWECNYKKWEKNRKKRMNSDVVDQ